MTITTITPYQSQGYKDALARAYANLATLRARSKLIERHPVPTQSSFHKAYRVALKKFERQKKRVSQYHQMQTLITLGPLAREVNDRHLIGRGRIWRLTPEIKERLQGVSGYVFRNIRIEAGYFTTISPTLIFRAEVDLVMWRLMSD